MWSKKRIEITQPKNYEKINMNFFASNLKNDSLHSKVNKILKN